MGSPPRGAGTAAGPARVRRSHTGQGTMAENSRFKKKVHFGGTVPPLQHARLVLRVFVLRQSRRRGRVACCVGDHLPNCVPRDVSLVAIGAFSCFPLRVEIRRACGEAVVGVGMQVALWLLDSWGTPVGRALSPFQQLDSCSQQPGSSPAGEGGGIGRCMRGPVQRQFGSLCAVLSSRLSYSVRSAGPGWAPAWVLLWRGV